MWQFIPDDDSSIVQVTIFVDIITWFKGARVPDLRMVEIEFFVVLDREPQLPDTFYRIKKY